MDFLWPQMYSSSITRFVSPDIPAVVALPSKKITRRRNLNWMLCPHCRRIVVRDGYVARHGDRRKDPAAIRRPRHPSVKSQVEIRWLSPVHPVLVRVQCHVPPRPKLASQDEVAVAGEAAGPGSDRWTLVSCEDGRGYAARGYAASAAGRKDDQGTACRSLQSCSECGSDIVHVDGGTSASLGCWPDGPDQPDRW